MSEQFWGYTPGLQYPAAGYQGHKIRVSGWHGTYSFQVFDTKGRPVQEQTRFGTMWEAYGEAQAWIDEERDQAFAEQMYRQRGGVNRCS